MQHLPPDVFAAVLRQLPPADQGAVRLTCHAWRHRAFATLQHVTVRVPHAAECSPDAQQAGSAPLRLPTALCLLPAFTALRHLRIELPPHAERLPLHAGLPPCLQALTIVCSPDGKAAATPSHCPRPAPQPQQATVRLGALHAHPTLHTLTLVGVRVHAADLPTLRGLQAVQMFHCSVAEPAASAPVATPPRAASTGDAAMSSLGSTDSVLSEGDAWAGCDEDAQNGGVAFAPSEAYSPAPFGDDAAALGDAVRSCHRIHAGGAHARPPPRAASVSISNCLGLPASEAVRFVPLRGLAVADCGAELCRVLEATRTLTHLTSLKLDQRRDAAEAAAPPPPGGALLRGVLRLARLRELRLRIDASLLPPRRGGLAVLSALHDLTSLCVGQLLLGRDLCERGQGCAIGNADLAMLRGMPLLATLRISGAEVYHDDAAPDSLASLRFCRALRCLALDCCHSVGDLETFSIAHHSPHLVSLDLSYCQRVTELGLRKVAAAFGGLRALRLEGCYNFISDTSVMALHKLQALQCLSVAFCDRLSTHAAAALLRRLPSLVHFDTTFCDAVDLRALRELLAVPCGDEGLVWRPCRRAPLLLVNERGSLLYGQEAAPFGEGDAIGMQHDHCCQGSLAHGPLRAL